MISANHAPRDSDERLPFRLQPWSVFLSPSRKTSSSSHAIRICYSIAVRTLVMALSSASSSLLRVCARQQFSTTSRAAFASCQQQQRGVADVSRGSSFESPFGPSKESTLKIPDFSKYSAKSPRTNQVFSYFMAGTMGLGTAVGAKATVQGTSVS